MVVSGALCGLGMRRGRGPDGGSGAQCGLQERRRSRRARRCRDDPPAAPRPGRNTSPGPPRLARRCACSVAASSACSGSLGGDRPLPRQRIADTARAAPEPSAPSERSQGGAAARSGRGCRRRAGARPQPPAAATTGAGGMIELYAMTGTGLPAWRTPWKMLACRGGRSAVYIFDIDLSSSVDRIYPKMPHTSLNAERKLVAKGPRKRADDRSRAAKNFAEERRLGALWFRAARRLSGRAA